MLKTILALLLGVVIGGACSSTVEKSVSINVTADNVAVSGYDTVAYFTANDAIVGKSENSFVWNGAKWHFSTIENLEKFKAAPERYAPQFGGYCSYAVSKNYTANADPNAWKIVDGKLYLNYNPDVKKMWEAEQEQRIRDGENNWPELKKTLKKS